MNLQERLYPLWRSLSDLDARKKIAVASVALVAMTAIIILATRLNAPSTVPLYSNVSREDMNAMSRILSENNIRFTTNPEQGRIEVDPGYVASARMLLAEQGLPSSQESGYELFDRMNTIGLTSFMQDVTNKRAIEGELARTIQMIAGVNSARVHLVMAEKSAFRRALQGVPTASVVLKTHGRLQGQTIMAIRHMVAAAVPSLELDNVTIVGSDGMLLSAPDMGTMAGSSRLVELEREFERETANKIASALGAHLGGENFRVSVTAKLNSDKRRVDETVFDPDSKVERSTQIVREAGSSQNKESSPATTVEQNLPEENPNLGTGQSSLENNERREETTNFEINQKTISVVSEGYQVDRLSVALVVNATRMQQLVGVDASQEAIDAKLAELEEIVRSATQVSEARGDTVNVSLVEFLPVDETSTPAEPLSLMALVGMHAGAVINAIGLIIAAILFALLGVRPLLSFLSRNSSSDTSAGNPLAKVGAQVGGNGIPAAGGSQGSEAIGWNEGDTASGDSNFDAIMHQEARIRRQLESFVSQGEERAAIAIRQWLKDDLINTVDAAERSR